MNCGLCDLPLCWDSAARGPSQAQGGSRRLNRAHTTASRLHRNRLDESVRFFSPTQSRPRPRVIRAATHLPSRATPPSPAYERTTQPTHDHLSSSPTHHPHHSQPAFKANSPNSLLTPDPRHDPHLARKPPRARAAPEVAPDRAQPGERAVLRGLQVGRVAHLALWIVGVRRSAR